MFLAGNSHVGCNHQHSVPLTPRHFESNLLITFSAFIALIAKFHVDHPIYVVLFAAQGYHTNVKGAPLLCIPFRSRNFAPTSFYSSGLYTASLHNTVTFLKNLLHSRGSPEAFTNITSTTPSMMTAKLILPLIVQNLPSTVLILI